MPSMWVKSFTERRALRAVLCAASIVAREAKRKAEEEARRVQIPITDRDFAALPEVIMEPDSVVLGVKNHRGRKQMFSVKTMPYGTLLVAEEVRVGKKALALVSVRKVPGAKNAKELLPSVLLNVRNDAGGPYFISPENLGLLTLEADTDGKRRMVGGTPATPHLRC